MKSKSKLLNKKKPKNYITKLFFRIFLSSLLLLFLIIFDNHLIKKSIIKNELNKNINFLKYFKNINSQFGNIINFKDVTNVDNLVTYDEIRYNNNTNYLTNYTFDGCYSISEGVITKIYKDEGLYQITVKGIDDCEYIYDNLESVDLNIYNYVLKGTILGKIKRTNNYYQTSLIIVKEGFYYDYFTKNEN